MNPSARDDLLDALCEEGAYSPESAIHIADQYRDQVLREQAAERAALEAAVERRVADWIETHDPADELTWFINSLREGLAAHTVCSQCYDPDEEQR